MTPDGPYDYAREKWDAERASWRLPQIPEPGHTEVTPTRVEAEADQRGER